jgi:hypothetical protein
MTYLGWRYSGPVLWQGSAPWGPSPSASARVKEATLLDDDDPALERAREAIAKAKGDVDGQRNGGK